MKQQLLDGLLAVRATSHPDRPFLRLREGERTFAEVDVAATELAHGLADLGVEAGAVVASLLPNCLEAAVLPFAITRRGAAHAPINTAFRAHVLARVLNLTRAQVLILDESLAEAIEGVADELEHLRQVLVRGDATAVGARLPDFEVRPFSLLHGADRTPIPSRNAPTDLAMLLLTSGTTGRSKACMLSHRFAIRQAELMIEHNELRFDDVLYCPFPLVHLDALVLTVVPALVLDANDNIFFIGRRKEAIRRRGENISAFEIEEVVLTHPGVLDAAAYGVPSDLSEEEVMVAVVARPGHVIDFDDLIVHCSTHMARYMIPRYLDVLEALPLTPTEKVEKYRLVERGVTPSTWDREAHGR